VGPIGVPHRLASVRPAGLGAGRTGQHRAPRKAWAVMTTAADAVVLEGLRTRYRSASALEDITLAIRQHETFGLMGGRGAGKSTLLKSILMLVAPHAGAIRIFGEPHHLPASRRLVAYFPDASSRRATFSATIS
jgi:ABC-type Mn2+/Zn2+ transport system ATPase subunit